MFRTSLRVLLCGTLIATAACTKKPKELPPPPPQERMDSGPQGPTDQGPANQGIVPGSRADFLAQAGSDRIFFGTDQYNVDDQSKATLDKQAAWLNKYPNVRFTIEGHCDERGTREYNLALGDRRANATKDYLAAQGISTSRITTISYGKERPEVPGSDENAWQQNRRAVTVVLQ
jgi:peptidoglycan-associated lipoprotein